MCSYTYRSNSGLSSDYTRVEAVVRPRCDSATPPVMDACFAAFDEDKDGFISLAEFALICRVLFRNDQGKIYGLEEDRLREIFSVFDTDCNGLIDRKEFEVCRVTTCASSLFTIGSSYISFPLAVRAFINYNLSCESSRALFLLRIMAHYYNYLALLGL
jgi:Ca2+-binding EF-hand superfamily protein